MITLKITKNHQGFTRDLPFLQNLSHSHAFQGETSPPPSFKICRNISFLCPVFSRISTESSVLIQENTGQRKFILWYFLRSVKKKKRYLACYNLQLVLAIRIAQFCLLRTLSRVCQVCVFQSRFTQFMQVLIKQQYSSIAIPLDGTHLVAVSGLITKKFQPECVNEESSTERRS